MPMYNFECKNCKAKESKSMSIHDFKVIAKMPQACSSCKEITLLHSFGIPQFNIDRDAQAMVMEMKDDVARIVQKVKDGDEATINDIYGETVNKLKSK